MRIKKETKELYAIAILTGDWHFSHDPPVSRSESRSAWYDFQGQIINELIQFAVYRKGIDGPLPIFVAGDLLDKWKSDPQLVNFLIRNLCDGIYAVPGNHDLKNHSLEDVRHTSYWTLIETGKVNHLGTAGLTIPRSNPLLRVFGFAHGVELMPHDEQYSIPTISLAVVHDYIWHGEKSKYPGAPEDKELNQHLKGLEGYDAAVFGDNHKSIYYNCLPSANIINCGTLMRRKSDERKHRSHVGILYSDGSIKKKYLNPIDEQWRETTDEIIAGGIAKSGVAIAEFLTTIRELGDLSLDFREAVQAYLRTSKISGAVRRAIVEIMEACNDR